MKDDKYLKMEVFTIKEIEELDKAERELKEKKLKDKVEFVKKGIRKVYIEGGDFYHFGGMLGFTVNEILEMRSEFKGLVIQKRERDLIFRGEKTNIEFLKEHSDEYIIL